MKIEFIELIKKESLNFTFQANSLETVAANLKTKIPCFSLNKIKILLITFNFKKNEHKSNEMLINLIQHSNDEELILIFNRITVFNEEIRNYCNLFINNRKLRPTILKIYKEYKLEETEITDYNLLFNKLNTVEFKKVRNRMKKIEFEMATSYIPKLNEQGIRNLKQIYPNEYLQLFKLSSHHRSELIRMEYFKQIKSLEEAFHFFRVNFTITNKEVKDQIIKAFKVLLKETFNNKITGMRSKEMELTQEFYNSYIKYTCRSKDLEMKQLGLLLLVSVFEYLEDKKEMKNMLFECLFDHNHEIRNIGKAFGGIFDCDYAFNSLICEDINFIDAVSFLLFCNKNYSTEFKDKSFFEEFNKAVENGKSCYGFIFYYNSFYLEKLVISKYKEKIEDLICQVHDGCRTQGDLYMKSKINKEYLKYLILKNETDIPVKALLKTNDLGMICYLRNLLDFKDIPSHKYEEYFNIGISEMKIKETNSRKSGGLSSFFLLMSFSYENYIRIRDTLYSIIFPGDINGNVSPSNEVLPIAFSGDINENVSPSNEVLIALNSLIALLNEFNHRDLEFYIKLGLHCLASKYFPIKNCGISLITSVLKKFLTGYKNLETIFISQPCLKKCALNYFKESINTNNVILNYHILFIYSKIPNILHEETQFIQESSDKGINTIMCQNILRNKSSSLNSSVELIQPGMLQYLLILTSKDLTELADLKTELVRLNIIGKSEQEDSSNEYILQKLIKNIADMGLTEEIKKKLLEIQFKNKQIYSEEYDDLDHILYLMEQY